MITESLSENNFMCQLNSDLRRDGKKAFLNCLPAIGAGSSFVTIVISYKLFFSTAIDLSNVYF